LPEVENRHPRSYRRRSEVRPAVFGDSAPTAIGWRRKGGKPAAPAQRRIGFGIAIL
jgi:hypothetical protein